MSKNKRLIIILSAIPFLLAIPLIGMQFSQEVDWTLFDFLIMGFLLTCTGLAIELVLRRFTSTESRIAFIAIVLAICFLIWAELAVGIFGTPFAGS